MCAVAENQNLVKVRIFLRYKKEVKEASNRGENSSPQVLIGVISTFSIKSSLRCEITTPQGLRHLYLVNQEKAVMMINGQKVPPLEVAVQLPDSKVAATENSGTMSGPLMGTPRPFGRKAEVLHVALRLLCMVTSVAALSFMVTAHQSSSISIYGFMLRVYSKWSLSHSFE